MVMMAFDGEGEMQRRRRRRRGLTSVALKYPSLPYRVGRRVEHLPTAINNTTPRMDFRKDPSLIDVIKRDTKICERITFHKQRITENATLLNGYTAQGISESHHQYQKVYDT